MTDVKKEWARLIDENNRLKEENEMLRARVEAYISIIERFRVIANDDGKPE